MAQTLRDWYRYLERQMHVSLPEPASPVNGGPLAPIIRARGASQDAPARAAPVARDPLAVSAGVANPDGSGRTAGARPMSRAALEAEAHADAVRRSLGTAPDQRVLPIELGPRGRGRGGRRPITESREEIIRRLLNPELSLHEAAAVLNLSKATVRRYTDQGRLMCLRTEGGQRRFRLSALLGFLDEQSQARGETG
jgi:excisionase family DNA binding protein